MSKLSNIVGLELVGSGQGFQNKFPTPLSKSNLVSSASPDEISKIIDKAVKTGVIIDEGARGFDTNTKRQIIIATLNSEQKTSGDEPSFMPNYGDFDEEDENKDSPQSTFRGSENDFDIQDFLDGEGEGDGEGQGEGEEEEEEGEGQGQGEGQEEEEEEEEEEGEGEGEQEGEGESQSQSEQEQEEETEEEKKEREEKEKEDEENRENLNLIPLVIIPKALKKNKDAKFSIKEKGVDLIVKLKLDNKYYDVQGEFEHEMIGLFELENTFAKQVNLLNKEYEIFAKSYNEKVLTKYKAK